MGKRGQISLEFIVVYGFALMMLLPLIIIFYNQSAHTSDTLNSNQVRNIINRITDKTESIYYYGEPSRTTLKVVFPNGIESITIQGREIVFNYRSAEDTVHEIVGVSLVNMSGSLSRNPGIHYIRIESKGSYVSISE